MEIFDEKEISITKFATHVNSYNYYDSWICGYNIKTSRYKEKVEKKYINFFNLKKIIDTLVKNKTEIINRNHILKEHVKLTSKEIYKNQTIKETKKSNIICLTLIDDIYFKKNIKLPEKLKNIEEQKYITNKKKEILNNFVDLMIHSAKEELKKCKFRSLSDFSISDDKLKIQWRISFCECSNKLIFPLCVLNNLEKWNYAKYLILYFDKHGNWNLRCE